MPDSESSLDTPEIAKLSKRRRLWPWLGLLVAVIGVAILIWKLFDGPAQGTVKNPAPTAPPPQTSAAWIQYNGPFFRISHPVTYQPIAGSKPAGLADNLMLISNHGTTTLAVALIKEDDINRDPAVQTRRSHPADYAGQATQLAAGSGWIFTNLTNRYSQALYLPHRGYVLSIALTDSTGQDHNREFNAITQTFSWKF